MSGTTPSCSPLSQTGADAETCIKSGGTLTTGVCNKDGACGGSTVCCEGVSINEGCALNPVAQPDGCAAATEGACDSLSPAGRPATQSVPFTTCVQTDNGGMCLGPGAGSGAQ